MNTNAVSTALFDEQAGRYYVGMSSNGEKIPVAGFETFYPDTVAQIYPAAFGFDGLDKKTAGALYDAFCKHYEWEAFDERIKEQTAYYWTMTSYVGAINQDETRVQAFMAHYTDHLQADHAFPLYNADIAWVSLSCARMIERYDEQIDELNFLGLFNEY